MSESPDPEIQFCLNRNEEGHGDVIDDDQYAYDEHGSNQIHSDGEETIYTGQNQNHSHHPRCEANNTSTIPIRSFPNFGPTLKPEPFNGHFFRNCPTFIQCKTCTSNGDDDGKNEAPSQGNKRPSSTYNQGNDRPLIQ
ncbi:hypothetical protein ACJMK2_017792 [Sinanodonta woodiana]|uniref:Uncharacterized protein n=1 Tax=Sinanodonta woodiana TaxID=1069815 RepID=A0ABD3UEE7_SINWO